MRTIHRDGRVDSNGSKVGPSLAISYPTSYSLAALTCLLLDVGRPLSVGTEHCGTGDDHFSGKNGHLDSLG
jgi:hypothetical protein